jgi:hypothetical protein
MPERRRTPRATNRTTATTPGIPVVDPDGSAAVRDTADDRAAQSQGHSEAVAPTYEEIAEAAYQRYLARGGQHGYDLDDWIDAERALLRARQ